MTSLETFKYIMKGIGLLALLHLASCDADDASDATTDEEGEGGEGGEGGAVPGSGGAASGSGGRVSVTGSGGATSNGKDVSEDLDLPLMSFDTIAATADGDFLVAGDWLGEEQGPGLMRITLQGDVRWARALLEGALPEPAPALGSISMGVPVIGPNNEVFVSGRTSVSLFDAEKSAPDGALDSYYAQLDVESGEVLSYVQTGDAYGIGSASIVAVDAAGDLYLSVYDYDLTRTQHPNLYYAEKMNAERETQWRVEFPSLITVVGVTSDAQLYIVYDGALLGYSSEGDLETETELPADVSSVEVMVDGSVLFVSNGFVVANGGVQSGSRELAYLAKVDPSDGEVLWKTEVHGATGVFSSSDGQALYVRSINDDEDTTPVFRLDASSGDIEWTSEIRASAVDATNSFLADVPASGRPTIWISSAEDGAPLAEWY